MPLSHSVCLSCRLRLLTSVHTTTAFRSAAGVAHSGKRRAATTTGGHRNRQLQPLTAQSLKDVSAKKPLRHLSSLRGKDDAESQVPGEEEDLEVNNAQEFDDVQADEREATDASDPMEALRQLTAQHDPEYVATAARQFFGDRLPQGALSPEQYKIYERLYGPPLRDIDESEVTEEDGQSSGDGDVLLTEAEDGLLEEVELIEDEANLEAYGQAEAQTEGELAPPTFLKRRSYADEQLQKDILATIQARSSEITLRSPDASNVIDEEADIEPADDALDASDVIDRIRTHPLTLSYRSGTSPTTLPLPRAAMTDPVSLLLSNLANRHLDETAERLFGGLGLPYSPSTPISSRTKPQKPIPISPSHGRMSDIEADVYFAAVMPGTYAAVTSALVEVRRRLGAKWLENLLRKPGGPNILDAGAGGAGVLAWREVLKAEWHRMHSDTSTTSGGLDASDTSAASDQMSESATPPAPLGKASVLTASPTLRHRASFLLEDTTFLPRLPDYVHAQFPSEDAKRKQFDIIVAPHSLWHLQESYERRQMVLNLWNMLDPNGGVLLLLEKGVPRGFEVVADARQYLLDELFERKGALNETDAAPSNPDGSPSSKPGRLPRRAPGRILAPCPNHTKCPMYHVPGVSRQRKDYCRFSQRYIRPAYLQRMLGAKARNHDDIEFSYIAVQKGISHASDTNPLMPFTAAAAQPPPLTGAAATDRAFEGYDLLDADLAPTPSPQPSTTSAPVPEPREPQQTSAITIPSPLPRLILPPLKRAGHVHLDLCTPSGTLERWTVPRSFGRQAYRDARKARWGDLWALGAKQREGRRVRLGVEHMEQGIGTGKGARGLLEEEEEEEEDEEGYAEDEGGEVGMKKMKKKMKARVVERGRLKARKRKREETKALLGRNGRRDGDE